MSMLNEALDLAKYGIPVFPCHNPLPSGGCSCYRHDCNAPAKHPRTPNGLKDASADLDQVTKWWKEWPDANIGVPTGRPSGLMVLDIDDPSLVLDKALPYTVKVNTGRGWHLWFKAPPTEVRSFKVEPGLDLRCDGGYVMGPGSTHITGTVYEVADDKAPIGDAPEWLEDAIRDKDKPKDDFKATLDHSVPIQNGQRNDTLFKEAASLRGRGYDEAVILAAISEMNLQRCSPPLKKSEIEIIVQSACRYGPNDSKNDSKEMDSGAPATMTIPDKNPIIEDLLSESPAVTWLLPEIFPKGSLIALAGMPGVGKSYLSYTVGMALATGRPILGQQPDKPIKVVYFDQENSYHDRVQYERWAYQGLDQPNMELLAENFWRFPFILGTSDWVLRAEEVVALHKPDIMFFDTATPAFRIEDENDNAEAAIVIGKIRRLMNMSQPPATAIVLKHAKVQPDNGAYTLRGAKAWEGQVDGIIYHTMGEGRPRNDGLKATALNPSKTRAFGLRTKLKINPIWLPGKIGIRLELD
jgi:hypothetical protein